MELPLHHGCTGADSRPELLTNEHKEDASGHLQEQRDADEGDQHAVILRGWPLLQHRSQLLGVGQEESHAQHALWHALLGGIMVQVDGLAPAGSPRL